MTSPLFGCFLKTKRAHQHIRELHSLIDGFLETKPYRVIADVDSDSPEQEADIYVVPSEQPKTIEWGIRIGDVVHNLRSALDQMVFALSEICSGPAPRPIPKDSPWRRFGFPVVLKESDWGTVENRELGGLWPEFRTTIRELQPFEADGEPDQHPLAVLHELWNSDKHRAITLVNTFVDMRGAASIPPHLTAVPENTYFTGLAVDIIEKAAPGRPLGDGAKVGRIRLRGYPLTAGAIQEYVNVYLHFGIEIAFEEGPPAYGGRLIKTLTRLDDTVTAILVAMDEGVSQGVPPSKG